jgi:hypothetical protein
MEMQDTLDVTPCDLVCSHRKWWETFNVRHFKCATQRHSHLQQLCAVCDIKWLSVERSGNDGWGVKVNYSDKILSICYVAHLKSHSFPSWHAVDTWRYLTETLQYLLLLLSHYVRYCHINTSTGCKYKQFLNTSLSCNIKERPITKERSFMPLPLD